MAEISERPQPFRHLLAAPWFYRLGFVAARAVPVPVLYAIADGLGVATYLTCGRLVTAVGANLARAFPQASARERSRLTQRIFRNYARYLVDYGRLRWARREGFEGLIPALEGEDHLRRVFAVGRGVILVTGHVGNWELGGTFFGQSGVKVHVVTLPDGHRQIDAIRERYRGRHAISTIVLDGSPFASLEMMAALKRGETGGHAGGPVGGSGWDRVALLRGDAPPSPRPLCVEPDDRGADPACLRGARRRLLPGNRGAPLRRRGGRSGTLCGARQRRAGARHPTLPRSVV